MAIKFKFNEEKALQAAAILLKLHGGYIEYLGLMKRLYLADRIALDRFEQPISGDRYVSMDFGPVLSRVYDLGKSGESSSLWREYVSSPYFACPHGSFERRKFVKLLKDPGVDELCEAEEEILAEVHQTCKGVDSFLIAEYTHYLPEWKNPHGSSIPIRVEDILKSLHKTDEEIKEIQHEVEREAYFDQLLNV